VPDAEQSSPPGVASGRPDGMSWMFRRVDRLIHYLALVSDQLSAFICAFLIVATTAAMIVYQAGVAIPWLDDVLRMLLIWLVYLGTVSLCLHNDHISMDAVYLRLPRKIRKGVDVFVAMVGIGLCAFTTKIGYDSLRQALEYGEHLPSGYIPSWPQDLVIPLCFGLMTLAYVSHFCAILVGRHKRAPSEAERAVELL
jgi:C4-dicarboxylate transporter DctQ subunit